MGTTAAAAASVRFRRCLGNDPLRGTSYSLGHLARPTSASGLSLDQDSYQGKRLVPL